MAKSEIVSWLHENYIEDENECVMSNDLKHHFGEKFGILKHLWRYVRLSFPSVTHVKHRRTDDWTKYCYAYKGIGKRNHSTDGTVMSLNQISSSLPIGFFVLKRDDFLLRFGKSTELQCNGNRIIMEVELSHVGKLNIFMGGKSVISHSGICEEVSMQRASIDGLLVSLNAVRFCEGIVHNKHLIENKDNIVLQKNSDNEYVIYSTSCKKILTFTCLKKTKACEDCKILDRNLTKKADTIVNGKENSYNFTCAANDVSKNIAELSRPGSSQSDDVMSILKEKAPYLSSSQLNLIQSQLRNSSVSEKHSRRWDSDIIQLTLSIWKRSPKTYEQLVKSGHLLLPSVSTLSRYKDVEQDAGLNNDVFKPMYMEACNRNIPNSVETVNQLTDHGYYFKATRDGFNINGLPLYLEDI